MQKKTSNNGGHSMLPSVDGTQVLERRYNRPTDLGSNRFAIGFYLFRLKMTSNSAVILQDGVSFQIIAELLKELGYRKRYTVRHYEFVRVIDNIMEPVTEDIIKSHIVRIAEAESGPLHIEYQGCAATFTRETILEVFRRNVNAILNRSFFETLPRYDTPLLKDTKEAAYFPYANGVVKIVSNSIVLIPYSDLQGYTIWKSHINPRVFTWKDPTVKNCQFMRLVNNLAAGEPQRRDSLCSGIGYSLHNYNHSAIGRAWMLYDEKPTRKGTANGGTGKGLVCQAVGKMRETVILDGKAFDRNNRFCLQNVDITTQVAVIDDARRDMDFSSVYSMITEGITIEKKHEAEIKILADQSPKIIITSNNVVGGLGTSDIRRQFITELSDYYSSRIKAGGLSPVEEEHGILFANDIWAADQWNTFYSFMLQCVQLYLQRGLITYEFKNLGRNRILQHCGEDFLTWVEQQNFIPGVEYNLDDLYESYHDTYYGEYQKYPFKTFGNHIKTFGEVSGWTCQRRRSNHTNYFTYQIQAAAQVAAEN